MKSSFSWPGRPPAEMISRNVNRLLTSILGGTLKRGAFCTSILGGSPKRGAFFTSILDGTLKRGAFCTSILDGTPKRGAFCTSILGGSPKRGAFCTSILGGTPKRGAFFTSILGGTPKRGAFFGRQGRGVSNTPSKRSRMGTRVAKGSQTRDSLSPAGPFDGAYAIRPYDGTPKRGAFFGRQGRGVSNTPSKRSRMETRVTKGSQASDSLSPAGPFDGAYAIRPYDGTSKEGAFCTSYLVATPKRGAFCTSILGGTPKRGAFFGCQGRGVSNTPSKRSRMGTRVAKGSQTSDSLSPAGPLDGAYAIRPYDGTSKEGASYTSYLVATPKRGAFCTSYLVATLKRGAFCTSYLVATLKRGAFLCTRVGAYCIRPTKRSRKGTRSAKGDQTHDFLSPTGPFGGAYAIRPYHATSKRDAFSSSFSIVVFSSFIFLCLSSLFSSGKSSFRCSVMCAP